MTKRVLKTAFLLALLAVLLTLSATAFAQSKSIVMERRDADITIQDNGDVDMVEMWQVRFVGGPFVTASRTIPLNYVNGISVQGVSEGNTQYTQSGVGNEGTFQVTNQDDGTRIAWSFSPTSDRVRTFTLHYVLNGALRIYPGGDQFWWKFIESGRSYPINASRVTVHLPSAFDPAQLKASTYPASGQALIANDGRAVRFEGGPFPANTEWEIRAQFPHGVVKVTAPSWQAGADAEAQRLAAQQTAQLYELAGGFLTLIAGTLGALVYYFTRKRPHPVRLPAEYITQPPDKLTPAMAGALMEGKATPRLVVATLIDLARRGLVKMDALKDGDFQLTKTGADDKGLVLYEKELLTQFFGSKKKQLLSDRKQGFASNVRELEAEVEDELTRQGYFNKLNGPLRGFWDDFESMLKYGPPVLFGLILLSVFLVSVFGWLALFDLFVVVIVVALFGWVYMRQVRRSRLGEQAAARWNAFKRYLENIKQYIKVDESKTLFEQYLPYAIAFGMEKAWINTFTDLDAPAPTWYHDDTPHAWQRHSEPDHPSSATVSAGSSSSTGKPTPSLNEMADSAFRGLNSMSDSLMNMLNSATSTFSAPPPASHAGHGSSSSSSSSDSSSSSSSDWSSSSSDSGSWSGGGDSGGGGGGGGSSDFG